MPKEFWREVVDRVAAEVPGTLLLAEAFWMLEGYFVRTLGMHRVYNSAFMHMLRDEDGAGYRRVITDTLGFHPEILKRYVNFMSNPDEATAVEQFGKGDKYFGVATLMATMPGLPMLGHGQVQGFGEKYGMEFRRATLDERADPWLVERHEREIFPLLRRRTWFAEASDFLLYDVVTDAGTVDEQVFAYSNGSGPTRSLVLFHDRFGTTTGTIRDSVPVAKILGEGRKRLGRRSLADGLALPNGAGDFVVFRDARTGLESIRSCREIRERGLRITLNAYEGHVFWEFREVHDGVRGPVGSARRDARRPGRSVARGCDDRAPARATARAAARDLRWRPRTGGAGGADRTRRSRRPRDAVRDVPDRDRDRHRCARRPRRRGGVGPRADGTGLQRRRAHPAGRSGDAPRLARTVTDRGAGTGRRCRGDQPGLVRRAAADRTARGGLSDRRPRRGRGVVGCRPGPRAPAPAAAVVDPRTEAHRRCPPARRVARGRCRPRRDRRQHLGRRRVARPRPLRRHARLGDSFGRRSNPIRRSTRPCQSVCSRPPKRPAIGSMRSTRPSRSPPGSRPRSATAPKATSTPKPTRRARPKDRPD